MTFPSAHIVLRSLLLAVAVALSFLAALLIGVGAASAQQDNFLNGTGIDGPATFADSNGGSAGNPPYIPNAVAPVSGAVPQGAISLTMGTKVPGSGANSVDFTDGRLVMIYQSNGVTGTPTSGDQSVTTLSSSTAGHWEFARVTTVSGSTLNFSPAAPLIYSYPAGTAQVIAVPEYTTMTLSLAATRVDARPWNGTSGGVLVTLANNTINFSGNGAEMRASGLGFRGGNTWINNPDPPFTGDTAGKCEINMLIGTALDSPLPFKGEGFWSTGYKVAPPVTDVRQIGRGNYLQGAGGGNCFNAAGAGGGNAGSGGSGGNSLDQAYPGDNDRPAGGIGGASISFDATAQMPFGGGGGAGDRDDAKDTSGAAGGGVVMVRGQTLTGRPRFTANGNNAPQQSNGFPWDGMGGGGAGGVAIARMVSTVSCTNTSWISATGGNGANSRSGSGYEWSPGGGGGGGSTYLQGSSITGNCGPNSAGGTRGTGSQRGSNNGNPGGSTSNVAAMAKPTLTINTPAPNPTGDNTPTITGTAGLGATTAYIYVDNLLVGTAPVSGGTWSFTPGTTISDGGHTITAYSRKADGMESDLASKPITIDTTPPPAPTITSGPTGFTNNNDPAFTFTGEPGGSYQCYVNPPSAVWAACSSGVSYTDLADGAHTFAVRQTDGVGNVGPAATRSFTVDTISPTIALTTPANGGLYNSLPAIAFTLTETNQGTTVCNLTGPGGPYTVNPCTNGGSLPALPNGTFTIQAVHTDLASNVGSSAVNTFTIDTVAPAAPVITLPADNSSTNDTTPTISGTSAEPGSTVTVRDASNNVICVDSTVALDGLWSCDASPALAQGNYTFTAKATDAAGNTSAASNAVHLTIDTVAPAAPVITLPADNSSTNDTTPTISGTSAEPGSTVTVRDASNNVICVDSTVALDGLWSCDASPALAPGNYTFTATATDAANNESTPSNAVDVEIDTTSPTVTLTTPANSATYNTAVIAVDFTLVEDNPGTSVCTITGPGGPYVVSPCTDGQNLPSLPDGTFSIQVVHTDAASNVGSSATHSFTVDTGDHTAPSAPTITSPADNSVTSDTTPTISGSGAEEGSTVTVYDGATVICIDTTVGNDGLWSCDASPALAPGNYTFTATSTDAANNESTPSNAVDVEIDTTPPAAPTITAPSNGPLGDNTPTVTGTGGQPNGPVTVYVDGNPVCSTTANGSGAWSCTSTTISDGPHVITATTEDPAGNESDPSAPVNVTVDTVAPAAPTIASPADGSTTTDNTPTVTGTGGQPNGPVTVYAGGHPICTTTADGSGNWSCTPGTSLSDGPHNLTATTEDPAGNESAPTAPVVLTIDTTPPNGNVVQQTGTGTGGHNPTFDISSDDTTATTTCSLDGGPSHSCSSPYTPTGTLSPGTHTLIVTFTDGLGNSSQKTITFVIASGNVDPLPAACFKKGITIIDLGPKGKTVTLRGFARLSYAGQKVTIRFKGTPKKVAATTVVQPDGSFVARFKAPAKKLWLTNLARYQAAVANEKTPWMKLSRRVRTATATFANGKLTVNGELVKPLMPKASAKITARTGCDQPWAKIGTTKITGSGKFSTTIPYAPETGVVFVRVETVVSSSAKKPKAARTFSYIMPVVLPQ
jgi:hypothetical protein